MEKYRSRHYMALLYPDNPDHVSVLEKIEQTYDHAYCLHDRDEWTEKDEKKNPTHKKGELKKAHYHVIFTVGKDPRWNTAIQTELGLEEKFLEKVDNRQNSLLYLMHYKNLDKAQYSIDEVYGNLKTVINEVIAKEEKSEGEKVVELIEFIEAYEGQLRVTEFAKYCATNGYWSEFRRSGAIFCKMIEEKNNRQ